LCGKRDGDGSAVGLRVQGHALDLEPVDDREEVADVRFERFIGRVAVG